MADPRRILLDDRLLVEELITGLPRPRARLELFTTSLWWYRACRAAMVGAGGHLSGPFARISDGMQARALLGLLELRDDIALPDPRATVPEMANVAIRHPKLNLLNLEVVAAALVRDVTVWLSEPAARGVLPSVMDAEDVSWQTVSIG